MLPQIWTTRNSVLNPAIDDIFENLFYGKPVLGGSSDIAWNPRVDVHENEKGYTIDAELPGIDKKDIKVEVKDKILTISGERKQEKKTEEAKYYKEERYYGKFQRTFSLPDTVDTEKISANYKDGILTLYLLKQEKALPKEISVEVK